MPTDVLDDLINSAPPAAAPNSGRDPLDQMLDDVPHFNTNPLNIPLARVPVPGGLGGSRASEADKDQQNRYTRYLNDFQAQTSRKPAPPGKQWVPASYEDFQTADAANQQEAQFRQKLANDAFSKIPHELRGYTPEETANETAAAAGNPITPVRATSADVAASPEYRGATGIASGVEQMAEPTDADKLRGAGKVVTGALGLATRPMIALGASAPLEAAGYYALGHGLGIGGKEIALRSGMSPEDAQEVGDVAEAAPLFWGAGKILEGRLSDAIDTHNARAEALFDAEAQTGRRTAAGAYTAVRTMGKPIPVKLQMPEGPAGPNGEPPSFATKPAQVELSDVSMGGPTAGRPAFRVVDDNGQTLFSGFANEVKSWLAQRGAEPGDTAATEQEPDAPRTGRRAWEQSLGAQVQPDLTRASSPSLDPADLQTLSELGHRNPDELNDSEIDRLANVADKLHALQQARDAQVDPFAGFEQEAAASLGKNAPVEPSEAPPTPPKPTQTERVSPDTPNPPTAAVPTTPESPETLALQMQQLGAGQRKVVMFPKGTPTPTPGTYPPGTAITSDGLGNTYIYRNDLTTRSAVKRAAKNNQLHTLLGSTDMGMGTVDKSALQGDPITVVARGPDGTEAQSTATDQANLPATIAASQQVTPPGGTVSIEPPEQVLAEREAVTPPELPPTPRTRLQQIDAELRSPDLTPERHDQLAEEFSQIVAAQRPLAAPDLAAPPSLEPEPATPAAKPEPDTTNADAAVPHTPEPSVRLPQELAGAQPRYSFGQKRFTLAFADDRDKAAYITAQEKPSQHDAKYLEWLQSQTGLSDEEIRQHGQAIRQAIKAQARNAEPGELAVPASRRWETSSTAATTETPAAPKDNYARLKEIAAKYDWENRGSSTKDIVARLLGDVTWDQAGRLLERWHEERRLENMRRRAPGMSDEELAEAIAAAKGAEKKIFQQERTNRQNALQTPTATQHEFSSTQVNLSGPIADALKAYGKRIAASKLAEDGVETEPHITVKYGLHGDDASEVAKVLAGEPPITVRLGKTSLFRNDDADVLKIDVDSPDLHRLNKKIADALPHTDTHPEYKPHVTIAYLKPGQGKLYNGKIVVGVTGKTITLDSVAFSGKDGQQVDIPLAKQAPDLATPQGLEQAPSTAEDQERGIQEQISRISAALQHNAEPAELQRQIAQSREALQAFPDVAESRKQELQRLITVAENRLKPAQTATDLAAPQGLEPTVPAKAPQPAKIEANGDREGTAAGESRANEPARPADSPALAGASSELRPQSQTEGNAPSDRRTGSNRPLGNLQQRPEQRTGGGPGERTGETKLDSAGIQRPERVDSGDLTRETSGHDFRITDDVGVGQGTPREKLNANLEAIRLVKQIEADQRLATPDEQRKLARYVGWGGLWQIFDYGKREYAGAREELQSLLTPEEYKAAEASTKNAHYTSPLVVRSMWDALARLGLKPGFSVLEPSMGSGNFFGLQPDSLLPARRTGVELDKITGAIAKALYPDSNVQVTGFEKIALPHDFFDLAISNVPFGNYGVYDPKYKKTPVATESIHNYFFAKGLDLVRPGGIVAFVTSRYTMDAQSPALRKLLASKADLVGMMRLPDTAFKSNAGTEVVTDIIFLRKRAPEEAPGGYSFLDTSDVPTADGGATTVNEYYAAHPEMLLGKLTLEGKMYGAGQQTLKGDLTPEILQAAIDKLPRGIFREWKPETPVFEGSGYVTLGDAVKDGGYDVKDGVVVRRDGNIYRPVKVGLTQEARIKGMLPVRAAVREVFATQIAEAPEKEILAARKKLNQTYDAFAKKFGPLNNSANSRALGEDPDYPVLAALENDFDKETNTAKKAAIFSQRTIERAKSPDKADKASEALAIVLNEVGRLDWDRMQQLTGRTPDELREELDGIVFQNPAGRRWETSDDYLSGNVREKLELARQAAQADPKYQRNVDALEKVQPRDLLPEEIKVTLGAPWIPPEAIADFLKKVLDLDGAKAHYSPTVATWSVTVPKWSQQRAANTTTYGTPDYYAHDLVDLALNGKGPKVYTGPADKREVDPKATAAAQAAQDALKEKFKEWLWEQPYADKLAAKYNREMNNLRLVDHDGSHLTLPGSNPAIKLRPHQKNVIWRALKTGNTLLAHEVGAGKTWEMVGIAMESRRLGLAKKPILAVPNHMAEQVSVEFAQLYPAARVLTIGKDDFAAENRKKAIARITSGNWDAVIIRHSSFERIPVSDETYKAFVDSQVEDLKAALLEQTKEVGKGAEKDKTVKEIQKAISRLEVKLQKRLAREKKDDAASFEELGVDLMLVDEAHAFKALPIITRRTRVAGIPTRESNRATDMFMKTQYVSQLNGGKRGVIFATGTPVTNTMAELYNMQRYLQPQALKDAGVAHFDAWANTFGEILRGVELDVSGKGFRENERFAKFINIPELMTMYRQMADVKTAEMMNLPRPDLQSGAPKAITAPESPELTAFVNSLVKRSEAIRAGRVDKTEDNMLKVVSEGKKAALDMRLIDPDAEDRPDSKVNKAVQNIYDIWKETTPDRSTQIVFCDLSTPKSSKKAKPKAKATEDESSDESDNAAIPEAAGERAGFSVYDDMKAKLMRLGIPSNEIAFIHDAESDVKKQELFDAVNAGKVRVLMGSTEKMGVGTNVQKRAIALHHMDAPWRPADIKQRDGRILRQGNLNKIIRIFQYLAEGSFDAYSWQLLENKARFIGPVLSGELTIREMEDIGMVLPSAAEFKAMASGNPLIKEKIGTDAALGRLDAQRSGHRKQQAGIKQQLASLPGMIDGAQRVLSEISTDAQTIEQNKDAGYVIGRKKFTGEDARKQAAEALGKALDSWRGPGNPQQIGTYKGLELWTTPGTMPDAYPGLTLRGSHSYPANTNPENPAGTLQSIENVVRSIPERLPAWQKSLDENRKKQSELLEQQGKPWPGEAKYQELVKRKAAIDAQLAESEAEKAATTDAEQHEPAMMRSFQPYQDTKSNLDQADAQYVGETAEGQAMQKGLRRGRGRVYVNQASANLLRQIFEHLSPGRDFSDSDGFTVPAGYAHRVAELLADNTSTDPRFSSLNEAFQTAHLEGGAVAITVADTAVPRTKGQWKRTNYHEGIHAQQFRISARKRHLTESALRQLFQNSIVQKADAKLRAKFRYPQNAARIIREIVCFAGSGDYAAIDLDRSEALSVLEQYFTLLQKEHGNRALAVLRSIVPDLRKELLVGYASRRSGIRGPSSGTSGEAQRALSPETSARTGSGRGDLQRPASERPPGFFTEDTAEPDFSLPSVPTGRAKGSGDQVRRTGSGSVTLGSGLGALQDPLTEFLQKDIVPGAKSVTRTLRGALDDIQKAFAPQTRGVPAQKGAGLIREMGAEIDQRRDRAVAALEGYRSHFYKETPQEHGVYGLSVYDAIERGQTSDLSPVDQAFAKVARQLFDDRKDELSELGLVHSYIDNYLPHEYKNPDEASRWIQNWQSKRPMAGSEAFRKQRVYPTMREALEDPEFTLEAKFDNPVDFVLSKLGQMDKSITAHLAFEELSDGGWLKYVPAFGKVSAGLAPIDDRIFTVMGPRYGAVKIETSKSPSDLAAPEELPEPEDEIRDTPNVHPDDVRVFGRREMGKYYAAEPLAQVINNHLSPGISHLDAYKLWRGVNNTLNMIDLSVSYYHGLTTTLNSSFSDMALGMKQALAGKPLQGARSIGRGFTPFASVVSDIFRGTKIQRVWDGKDKNPDPMTAAIVDSLKQGGGKARQDLYYATSFTKGMISSWNQPGNPIGSAWGTIWRAPFAAMEQTMKPIMEYMVPRAKLGAFAKRAQLEIEQHPTMSLDEARRRFGKIWDSIDDRFGQLSQRNLLMNAKVRDVMNALIGRPGWNIGTARALVGGATDLLGNMRDLAQGKPPELSDRSAYLIALLLSGAILSGLVTYILTGTAPHGNDFLMPRDGGVTEDGRPSRIVLPTYVAKDLYSYLTRPLTTLKAKAAPALTVASDLLTNRNFQGQKIYGRGGVGVGKYLAGTVTPYALQGLAKNRERAASPVKQLLPFVGILPAGRRVGLTKAEQIITDYQDEQRPNTRPAPTDHTRARTQVFLAARSGDVAKARQLGQQAIAQGNLTAKDVATSIQRARQSPLVNDFQRLPLDVAMQVYQAGTPEERKQLQPLARKKALAARSKPYEWDDESRAIAAQHFGIRPAGPRAASDLAAPSALQ